MGHPLMHFLGGAASWSSEPALGQRLCEEGHRHLPWELIRGDDQLLDGKAHPKVPSKGARKLRQKAGLLILTSFLPLLTGTTHLPWSQMGKKKAPILCLESVT